METEYDRLASIKALGGQLVSTDSGSFWAIFDREYLEAVDTESRSPVLTARTSDAEWYAARKGTGITIGSTVYRVQRHEPDGTGMSVVFLEG
jgi:hypothetical protein